VVEQKAKIGFSKETNNANNTKKSDNVIETTNHSVMAKLAVKSMSNLCVSKLKQGVIDKFKRCCLNLKILVNIIKLKYFSHNKTREY